MVQAVISTQSHIKENRTCLLREKHLKMTKEGDMTDFQNMEKVTEEWLFTISHNMAKKEKCNKIIK